MNKLTVFVLLASLSLSSTYCTIKSKDKKGAEKSSSVPVNLKSMSKDHIAVYKYDGNKQCGMGKLIPLTEMAKELGEIKIFGSTNKSDGLMRTQVCGSIAGTANVYIINKSDLEKAKKLNFMQWTF